MMVVFCEVYDEVKVGFGVGVEFVSVEFKDVVEVF